MATGKISNDYLIDYSSQVTLSESDVMTISAKLKNGVVYLEYLGAKTAHNNNVTVFTLPAAIAPKSSMVVPFVYSQNNCSGAIFIYPNDDSASARKAIIRSISDTTAQGRIALVVSYIM